MEKYGEFPVFLIAVDYQQISEERGLAVGDLLHNVESLIPDKDCKHHQCTQ
jgi:hypothetical protein